MKSCTAKGAQIRPAAHSKQPNQPKNINLLSIYSQILPNIHFSVYIISSFILSNLNFLESLPAISCMRVSSFFCIFFACPPSLWTLRWRTSNLLQSSNSCSGLGNAGRIASCFLSKTFIRASFLSSFNNYNNNLTRKLNRKCKNAKLRLLVISFFLMLHNIRNSRNGSGRNFLQRLDFPVEIWRAVHKHLFHLSPKRVKDAEWG